MLGDTAVAVHPDDERYRDLVGKHAILPLVGRRIPIVADDYSDPEKGTGAVKITPAHDFNDFEVGRRHDLPLVNVLDVEAHRLGSRQRGFLADAALADLDAVAGLDGLDRFEARKERSSRCWRSAGSSRRSSRTPTWCRTATARACRSSRS